MKAYKYTLLKQDGTTREWVCSKLPFSEIYKELNCSMIEVIPNSYYPEGTKRGAICYGDEEGRFNQDNHRNPHMKVLKDFDGAEWDCVGNILKEEVSDVL